MSKNLEMILTLDKDTYPIDQQNYHQVKSKKTQIIVGGSLRKGSNHIQHLKTKDMGTTKKWPTYSITREGVIHQHYDPSYYSEYMGVKEIDKKSISIVLENMGMLFYDANKECFMNWINEECNDKLVYEKLWKNCRYWECYTNKQYDSLSLLCGQLCKEHDIILDSLGFNVYQEETDKFNGIVTRSNFDSDYTDLNPSFDFQKFLKKLNIPIE